MKLVKYLLNYHFQVTAITLLTVITVSALIVLLEREQKGYLNTNIVANVARRACTAPNVKPTTYEVSLKKDIYQRPVRYEITIHDTEGVNCKARSAGEDGLYNNNDDVVVEYNRFHGELSYQPGSKFDRWQQRDKLRSLARKRIEEQKKAARANRQQKEKTYAYSPFVFPAWQIEQRNNLLQWRIDQNNKQLKWKMDQARKSLKRRSRRF